MKDIARKNFRPFQGILRYRKDGQSPRSSSFWFRNSCRYLCGYPGKSRIASENKGRISGKKEKRAINEIVLTFQTNRTILTAILTKDSCDGAKETLRRNCLFFIGKFVL